MKLETKRLLIRDFTMEDADDLWEIFRDPVTMEHICPYTEQETRDFLRAFCVERTPPGAFAAVKKDSGRLIGYLLCNQIDEPASMNWAGSFTAPSGGRDTPMRRYPN